MTWISFKMLIQNYTFIIAHELWKEWSANHKDGTGVTYRSGLDGNGKYGCFFFKSEFGSSIFSMTVTSFKHEIYFIESNLNLSAVFLRFELMSLEQ